MKNEEIIKFLQWALPQIHMRWSGFRRVYRQVGKRISRRISVLKIENLKSYEKYLHEHPMEWEILDSLCRISISRFYRDRAVFDSFKSHIFPYLCSSQTNEIRVCSLGCCSGEEPYTVQMIWNHFIQSTVKLTLIAIDNDAHMLHRAQRGLYQPSSVRELPPELYRFFCRRGELFQLKDEIRKNVKFIKMDLRKKLPDGKFNLILCRNLVFTYYDDTMQKNILERLSKKISLEGLLIIGIHEKLPFSLGYFEVFDGLRGVFKRADHYFIRR